MDEKSLFAEFWSKEVQDDEQGAVDVFPRVPTIVPIRSRARRARSHGRSSNEEKMIIDALENGSAEWAPAPAPATMKELCEAYDRQSAEIVRRWQALPAARWAGTLEFFGSQRPASPMAWSFLFDIVHHRGQITTYLRPMGSTVPQIYGPSADEP